MSSEAMVEADGLTKDFEIFDRPYQRLVEFLRPGVSVKRFRALEDVTFTVRRGEAVGIIGRNGSGKSTLLQIVCDTLQPSSGSVRVSGRVAALLELGAGFNPEFTGRENVYLNGSLLGLTRQQIDARFEAILAFSEIGAYIDQAVKTYSSGMYVRLAFSVAVHSDPELLIVDEALAVGDTYFQRKCYRRIAELRAAGCTFLLVTHSMDSLVQICDRGIVLDAGRLIFDGDCKTAVNTYMRCLFGGLSDEPAEFDAGSEGATAAVWGARAAPAMDPVESVLASGANDVFAQRAGYNRDEERLGARDIVLGDFVVSGSSGIGTVLQAREPFTVHAKYAARRDLDRLVFGLQVRTVDGLVVYSTNTYVLDNETYSMAQDELRVVRFDLRCALLPAQYFMSIGVSRFEPGSSEAVAVDRRVDSVILTVLGPKGYTNGVADLEAVIRTEVVRAGVAR